MKLDELIFSVFNPLLAKAGFIFVQPRKWVRDTKLPIREIVKIQSLRGAYSVAWGFSIDFVPLYNNSKFSWHRTNKSCRFDLCIDPIDLSGDIPDWCSFTNIPGYKAPSLRKIEEVANKSVEVAFKDLDKILNLKDLANFYEERSHLEYRRFGFNNYIQNYLAWGLVLISLAQVEEGMKKINKFCDLFEVNKDDPFLLKAIENVKSNKALFEVN